MGYKQHSVTIGIDEAGRGPLAGPVAVGLVRIPRDFNWDVLPGVGDSKAMTVKKRAEIFARAKVLQSKGELDFVVILGSAKVIDKKGIAVVIAESIAKGLTRLRANHQTDFVKLDGALRAPATFAQATIIRGDQSELEIGLASIVAKETRDAVMVRAAKKYPLYGFEEHKGYGTKAHRNAILIHGLSEMHRVSYCKNHVSWGKV